MVQLSSNLDSGISIKEFLLLQRNPTNTQMESLQLIIMLAQHNIHLQGVQMNMHIFHWKPDATSFYKLTNNANSPSINVTYEKGVFYGAKLFMWDPEEDGTYLLEQGKKNIL